MPEPTMAIMGMGTMGSNLAYNFASSGYDIAIFNRTDWKTQAAYEQAGPLGFQENLHPVIGDVEDLVPVVGPDGVYILLIKADDPDEGFTPTQDVIDQLVPHLQPGAIIVDCANSHWRDTNQRCQEFKATGIDFFGIGVSGGEEGARYGPSLMPGGTSRQAYEDRLSSPLQSVAAKAPDGKPCVTYIGDNGAGHFVKMVHNGIEYGDMELIVEAYDLMKHTGLSAPEIGDVFAQWNEPERPLRSYLIEITADVLTQEDPAGDGYLIDKIKDAAQMKGTGTWTVMTSLGLRAGVEPIPTVYAAVESRAISAKKDHRGEMSQKVSLPPAEFAGDRARLIEDLEKALYVAKISSYAQGIALIQRAEGEYDFGQLDIADIASIWRAGCIIRADLLDEIMKAYEDDSQLPSLMAAPKFAHAVHEGFDSLQAVCRAANQMRVPSMAFEASRNFILQSVRERLPANLIQGLRDRFGSHTYERIDKDGVFHTDWSDSDRTESKVE